jgi:hypothetical protein
MKQLDHKMQQDKKLGLPNPVADKLGLRSTRFDGKKE